MRKTTEELRNEQITLENDILRLKLKKLETQAQPQYFTAELKEFKQSKVDTIMIGALLGLEIGRYIYIIFWQ